MLSGGGRPLKIEIDKKSVYIIEAVFLSDNQCYAPVVIRFSPKDAEFTSPLARLIKYSENVCLLEFNYLKTIAEGFFEPVSQIHFKQKGTEHTVTLYYDGFYYAQFENRHTVINKKINNDAKNLSLSVINLKDNNIAAIKGQIGNKIYCLLAACNEEYYFEEFFADSIEIKEGIVTVKNGLNDMAAHQCTVKIDYDGTNFIISEKKVEKQKPPAQPEKLIPYYFLEAVLAENYQQAIKLLSQNNYKDITSVQLKNFFGQYCDVVQNCYEKEFAAYPAIVRCQSKSLYTLSYYNFIVKEGLIENIVSIE